MTDPMTRMRIIEAMEGALAGGPPVVVATVTEGGATAARPGEKLLVREDGEALGAFSDEAVQRAAAEACREVFSAFPRVAVETLYVDAGGRATTRRHESRPGDAQVMLQFLESPARLIVVGAGHVGLALARMGEMLGFGVTVVDDREEFANRERFPMAEEVRCGDVGAELDTLPIDRTCYVVLVSRGHRQDEEALRRVVGRGAAYVGMIGSKRRTQTVLEHLLEGEYERPALEAVATPIGLDIGAETPEEIALSILAEIVMLRRGGTGRRMSADRAPLGRAAKRAN
jgi:xanthine dehydrogenase accessory factor